jgi:K+-sensing histidine kinase KdpD
MSEHGSSSARSDVAPEALRTRQRSWIAIATCVAGPLAVGLALVPFRARVTSANVALIFVLCVLAAAIARGRLGAALAALSSALWFDVLFTHPYGSLTINRADDMVTTGLLVVVGLIAGELVVRARRSVQAPSWPPAASRPERSSASCRTSWSSCSGSAAAGGSDRRTRRICPCSGTAVSA